MNLKQLKKSITKNFTLKDWFDWYFEGIILFFTGIPFRIKMWRNRPKYSIKTKSGLTVKNYEE